ncbi:MAG TPA: TonB-dependent receptor plug domain-containing protein, partial [Steroidobacteraceae bacterium]|nr:TonB-dependent receptor plug domain-containing protein [Steroidobacteraceae bacterium]
MSSGNVLAKSRRRRWLSILTLAGLAAPSVHAATARLVDLLRTLAASGYDILYSSDLVTADLTVPETDQSTDPLIRAKRALAGYHLELKDDGQRRFIVTRSLAPAAPQAAAAAARANEAALEEITVFASRYVLKDEQMSAAGSYGHDDIEQVPGTEQDALRAIRTVPGLADNLSSRPYVRGAFLEDVLVRFDGIPMMDPFHFKNFQNLISAFDPATVDRIDIYTGGFPVRYGTRSGGVIDVTPRALASGYENSLGANLLGYDVSSVGHSDSWPVDWLATARHSTPNITLQPTGDVGEPSYFDTLGRLRWQVSPATALTFGWLMMDDQVTSSTDPSAEQGVAHDRDVYSWIIADWTPSSQLHSRTSVAMTGMERTLNGELSLGAAASGQLRDDREITTVELRTGATYLQTSALLWDVGAESTFESADLAFSRQESLDPQLAASLGRAADA